MAGTTARDSTGHGHTAVYVPGVALYLGGPPLDRAAGAEPKNRAVHIAGGRIEGLLEPLGRCISLELWFWNGLPNDARTQTGLLCAREGGERLVLGGTACAPGRLLFACRDGSTALVGRTIVAPQTWNHLALVRDGDAVAVYLNGRLDLAGRASVEASGPRLAIGGEAHNSAGFEGKIDEVAVYDRALNAAEIAAHLGTVER
jgi:hypothetical protein